MKKLIFLIFFISIFIITAGGEDIFSVQKDAYGADKLEDLLPREAKEYEITMDNSADLNENILKILSGGRQQLGGIIRKGLLSSVILLAVVMLCSFLGSVYGMADSSGVPNYVIIAGALAITAAAIGDINSLTGLGRDTIENMDMFSKALLPTLAAASAASGAMAASAARHFATVLFSDILITVINRLLLPLVYAYMAVCAANAALSNDALSKIAAFIKWTITISLTVIMTVFTAYLTISGVISGSADAMTVKAARMTLSGAVPVVGGIISDAAETILIGAGMLKNSIGIIGMLSILAICIVPFLRLGIHYLIYKLTAALASTVSNPKLSGLIDNIGGVFGLILAMTASCALLILISIISTIQAVGVP